MVAIGLLKLVFDIPELEKQKAKIETTLNETITVYKGQDIWILNIDSVFIYQLFVM